MYMYIMYIYFDIFYLASYSQIIFVSSYGLLRLNWPAKKEAANFVQMSLSNTNCYKLL